MRQFVIVITEEGRLRFRFMQKEHGLLHDRAEKKSYAIVKDPYPTNWPGKWSRAYLVYEEHAQSVTLQPSTVTRGDTGSTAAEPARNGSTVEIAPPLNMLAKVTLPQLTGRPGQEAHIQLTAEAIYDRTQSAQVRRLGNRRIQWFHALLFVSLGVAICLVLTASILMFSGGNDSRRAVGVEIDPNVPPSVPQSGPAEQSTAVVRGLSVVNGWRSDASSRAVCGLRKNRETRCRKGLIVLHFLHVKHLCAMVMVRRRTILRAREEASRRSCDQVVDEVERALFILVAVANARSTCFRGQVFSERVVRAELLGAGAPQISMLFADMTSCVTKVASLCVRTENGRLLDIIERSVVPYALSSPQTFSK